MDTTSENTGSRGSETGKGGQLKSSTVKHIVTGAAGAQSHWGPLGGGEDIHPRVISLEERERWFHRSWVLGCSQGVRWLAHPGYLHVETSEGGTLILDFWSPNLQKHKFRMFSATQFGILCYTSPRTPHYQLLSLENLFLHLFPYNHLLLLYLPNIP